MSKTTKSSLEKLSPEQHRAIRYTRLLGKRIVDSKIGVDVAEDWIMGYTAREIAHRHDLYDIQLSDINTINSIIIAIHGHGGGYGVKKYKGLITDPTILRENREAHKLTGSRRGGRIAGPKTFAQGIGLYGMDDAAKCIAQMKGAGADFSSNMLSWTAQDRRKNSLVTVLKRGEIPMRVRVITDEQTLLSEIEAAYNMYLDPAYKTGKGTYGAMRLFNAWIVDDLNINWHDSEQVRNNLSVATRLCNFRKDLAVGKVDNNYFYTITDSKNLFEESPDMRTFLEQHFSKELGKV